MHLARPRSRAAAGLLALAVSPVLEAAIETADCDALASWAATLERQEVLPVSPALSLPEALGPEPLEALFGQPPLAWSGEDVLAARQAINACRKQAHRDGDAERARALGDANGMVARELRNVVRSVTRARKAVAEQLDAIAALPDSPDLAEAVRLLTSSDPGRPREARNALRGTERAVSRPFRALARALPDLPHAERETLFATLEARAGGAPVPTASLPAAQPPRPRASAGEPTAAATARAPQREPAQHDARPDAAEGCDTIATWAESIDPSVTWDVTPSHVLPEAFASAHLERVLGLPLSAWSRSDVGAARRAINDCRGEARRAGDAARAQALADAGGLVARDLATVVRDVSRARRIVAQQREAIAALDVSPQRTRALRVLVEADPADQRGMQDALQVLERDVWKPFFTLANALPALPHAEREALLAALVERERAAVAEALAGARAEIQSTPQTASGVISLERLRLRLEAMHDAGTQEAAAVIARTQTRLAAIREALRAASEPAWVPPTCRDLYRWSGAPDALEFVQIGPDGYRRAFAEERVTPLFGTPVAAWSDGDVQHLDALAHLCRERVQTRVESDRELRRPPPDAPELVRLASRGLWVENAKPELRRAQAAIEVRREALEEATSIRTHIEALPAHAASLTEIARAQRSPALTRLTPGERQEFGRFLEQQRARIAAGVEADLLAEMESIAVKGPADLGRLWAFGQQARRRVPATSLRRFGQRFEHRLAAAAREVLPTFRNGLTEIPVSEAGLETLRGALEERTGMPREGHELLPGFTDAIAGRAQEIATTLARARCDALWAEIELDGDDAALAVWDGEQGTTVGALTCALGEHGHAVHGFDPPGLLSDTATLEVTLDGQPFRRIALHEGEVAPDTRMLVGFEISDANETRALSVADWERFMARNAGRGGDADCERILSTPADRLSAEERVTALGCVFGEAVKRMRER